MREVDNEIRGTYLASYIRSAMVFVLLGAVVAVLLSVWVDMRRQLIVNQDLIEHTLDLLRDDAARIKETEFRQRRGQLRWKELGRLNPTLKMPDESAVNKAAREQE